MSAMRQTRSRHRRRLFRHGGGDRTREARASRSISSRSTRAGAPTARASASAARRCAPSETLGILDAFLRTRQRRGRRANCAPPHGHQDRQPADAAPGRAPMCRAAARSCARCSPASSRRRRARRASNVRLGADLRGVAADDGRRRGRVHRRNASGATISWSAPTGLYSRDARERVPRGAGAALHRPVRLARRAAPPPDVATVTMWLGPKVKAGLNPVSRDEMYLFVTEDRPSQRPHRGRATFCPCSRRC